MSSRVLVAQQKRAAAKEHVQPRSTGGGSFQPTGQKTTIAEASVAASIADQLPQESKREELSPGQQALRRYGTAFRSMLAKQRQEPDDGPTGEPRTQRKSAGRKPPKFFDAGSGGGHSTSWQPHGPSGSPSSPPPASSGVWQQTPDSGLQKQAMPDASATQRPAASPSERRPAKARKLATPPIFPPTSSVAARLQQAQGSQSEDLLQQSWGQPDGGPGSVKVSAGSTPEAFLQASGGERHPDLAGVGAQGGGSAAYSASVGIATPMQMQLDKTGKPPAYSGPRGMSNGSASALAQAWIDKDEAHADVKRLESSDGVKNAITNDKAHGARLKEEEAAGRAGGEYHKRLTKLREQNRKELDKLDSARQKAREADQRAKTAQGNVARTSDPWRTEKQARQQYEREKKKRERNPRRRARQDAARKRAERRAKHRRLRRGDRDDRRRRLDRERGRRDENRQDRNDSRRLARDPDMSAADFQSWSEALERKQAANEGIDNVNEMLEDSDLSDADRAELKKILSELEAEQRMAAADQYWAEHKGFPCDELDCCKPEHGKCRPECPPDEECNFPEGCCTPPPPPPEDLGPTTKPEKNRDKKRGEGGGQGKQAAETKTLTREEEEERKRKKRETGGENGKNVKTPSGGGVAGGNSRAPQIVVPTLPVLPEGALFSADVEVEPAIVFEEDDEEKEKDVPKGPDGDRFEEGEGSEGAASARKALKAKIRKKYAKLFKKVKNLVTDREKLDDGYKDARKGGAKGLDDALDALVEAIVDARMNAPSGDLPPHLEAVVWTLKQYTDPKRQADYRRDARSESLGEGSLSPYNPKDWKCNKLVADSYSAGAGRGLSVGSQLGGKRTSGEGFPAQKDKKTGLVYGPLANELAKKGQNLRSMTGARDVDENSSVSDALAATRDQKVKPRPGDIVAFPAEVGSGHSGLYLGKGLILSAKGSGIEVGTLSHERRQHSGKARVRQFTGSGK